MLPLSKGKKSFRHLLPYALSYPVATAIAGVSEVAHLEENIRIASTLERLSEEEMAEIRALADPGEEERV